MPTPKSPQSETRAAPAQTAPHTRRKQFLRMASWVALIISLPILFVLSAQLIGETQLQQDDYTIYWAAGRLNIFGGNPYSPDDLLTLEMAAGRVQNVPVMFWNPPWTLPVVMPLALLPYPLSRVLWYLLQLAIVIGAAHWAWHHYGGPQRWHWVAWGVGLIFGPALDVMKAGQISALPIIGAVGFMVLQQRRQYFWAGALLALVAIKPHTYYLLGAAIILWSLTQRKWSVLLGGAAALGSALGIALLFNPHVIQQYIYASVNYPPEQWATATLGVVLRMVFGIEQFWLQFVPPALGLLGFVIYWWPRRQTWDWEAQFTRVLALSTATAAYGWTFDNTVMLIPIVQITVGLFTRGSWKLKAVIFLAYVAWDSILIWVTQPQLWFWWAPLALAAWYLLSQWALSNAKTNQAILKPSAAHPSNLSPA